jgi:hypothetical protein
MEVTLTIIRYPKRFSFFGLSAMGLHRIAFWLNPGISFFKLLGCGKNGGFDKHPDWQQYGILSVHKTRADEQSSDHDQVIAGLYGAFISGWIKLFGCEKWTVFLEPVQGHGTWDGKQPFGPLRRDGQLDGTVAILTRATIRFSKLKAFWGNVNGVGARMADAAGLVTSIGIGEIPFIKQATFSIWESTDAMKQFAYQLREHTEVVRKTRQEDWYSEELFVRFRPLRSLGSLRGTDPLKGML